MLMQAVECMMITWWR